MFWRPIFRWECDAPESGACFGEFEADFGFAGAGGAEENDGAVLIFLGDFVMQVNFAAADEFGLHQNESAVGVDGESVGLFFKDFPIGIHAANADTDLHEDALAAAARARRIG